MKKFIISAVIASLIASPAMANTRHRGYDNYNRQRHSGVSTGEAVAIGLGALLLGGAIANSRNNNTSNAVPVYPYQSPQYAPPYALNQPYAPAITCQQVYVVNLYGNYVVDRSGRIVTQQICFQQ